MSDETDETDDQGRHRYTVAQIAAEFGATRPAIYRYLDQRSPTTDDDDPPA